MAQIETTKIENFTSPKLTTLNTVPEIKTLNLSDLKFDPDQEFSKNISQVEEFLKEKSPLPKYIYQNFYGLYLALKILHTKKRITLLEKYPSGLNLLLTSLAQIDDLEVKKIILHSLSLDHLAKHPPFQKIFKGHLPTLINLLIMVHHEYNMPKSSQFLMIQCILKILSEYYQSADYQKDWIVYGSMNKFLHLIFKIAFPFQEKKIDTSEMIDMISDNTSQNYLNEIENEKSDLIESEEYSLGSAINALGLLVVVNMDDLFTSNFPLKIFKEHLCYFLLHLKILIELNLQSKVHIETKGDKLTNFQKKRLSYYLKYLINGLIIIQNLTKYFQYFFQMKNLFLSQGKSSELLQAIILTTEVKEGDFSINTLEMIQGCIQELCRVK